MLRPPDTDADGNATGGGPTYAISMKKLNRGARRDNTPLPPLPAPRTAASAGETGATAQQATDESDGTDGNRSEHSGSSMQTVRIEDIALADEGPYVRKQMFPSLAINQTRNMEPSRYRGHFVAVFLLLFGGLLGRGAYAGEQEQLEQIVREPLRCERIDGTQGRLANEQEWRFLGGRAGDRLLLCDCAQAGQQNRLRNPFDPDDNEQQQPPFILPAFESTTVATDILIANCHQLLVPTGTFRALRAGFLPRTVRFVDIDQLTVESFAFETSGAPTAGAGNNIHDRHPILGPIALRFERCQLEELPANVFHGAALRSVQFVGTTIGAIRSLAVGIRLHQFRIADSVVGRFGRHSFKRAQMEQLQLHNVTMLEAWPSQAWQGLIVSESIRITNSTFLQAVHPAAIIESTTDELVIQNNVFNQSIADEAFQLAVKTRIWLIGNAFGQLSSNLFRGVVISNETAWNALPNILLERNLIETFDGRTFLVIPRNFSLSVQGFRIAQLATCESTNISAPAVWPEVFFLRPFSVTNRDDPSSYVSVEEYRQQEGCDAEGPDLVLVIVLASLLGVTLIGGGIGGFLCYRHHRKRQRMILLEQKLVQPTPRTYRETQILLKLETVGTLKTDF
ncbi:hypothetical protein ZHAS_00004786 [Anopheles sinensis]|uniref:Right handed beta helix domain-containing protein n=1 Tax=Anopheles sinensis TaxID=74873 RepID=A0A084VHV8_ANOSI|nr:hypothetical protein ZHAS_00004786 [Anopheles sinensis]